MVPGSPEMIKSEIVENLSWSAGKYNIDPVHMSLAFWRHLWDHNFCPDIISLVILAGINLKLDTEINDE